SRPRRRGGGEPRLVVSGLSLPAEQPFGTDLRDIAFEVRGGEIFGVAGVAGNGQTELLAARSGERTAARPDVVRIDGRPVGHLGAGTRRDLGLACVPEEREGHGAVPDMTLVENALLSGYRRMRLLAAGFVRSAAAARYATAVVERFRVVAASVDAAASSLSGGNLQKFIVGREILQTPGVLIAGQPTWGVDAGAAAAIHQALIDLAASGAAVLVVSQDLDELLSLSDRLAVINQGALSPPMVTPEASIEQIGLLIGGLHGLAPEPPYLGASTHVAYARAAARDRPGRGLDHPGDRHRAHRRDRLRAVHAHGPRPGRRALPLLRLAGAVALRPGRAGGQGDAARADWGRPRDRFSRRSVEHRRGG